MIIINKNVPICMNEYNMNKLLNAHTRGYLSLDVKEMECDKRAVEHLSHDINIPQKDRELCKKILVQIEDILKATSIYNKFYIRWKYKEQFGVQSEPYVWSIPRLNFDIVNYILKRDDSIICVDYTDIYNMVALEMAYGDLGVDINKIFDLVKEKGVNIITPEEIYKCTMKDIYTKACNLVVKNSDNKWRTKYFDYFGKEVSMKSNTYVELINNSLNKIMGHIMQQTLSKVVEHTELVGIFNNKIYYNLSNTDQTIISNVAIQIFGITVEVTPNITVM